MSVHMLGGTRPDVALAFLNEGLANESAAGFVVVAVDASGGCDLRVFGNVPRYSLTYAAALLNDHAMNGEFESRSGGGTGE